MPNNALSSSETEQRFSPQNKLECGDEFADNVSVFKMQSGTLAEFSMDVCKSRAWWTKPVISTECQDQLLGGF